MRKVTRESLFTLAYIVTGIAGALVAWTLTKGLRPVPVLPFIIVGFFGALIYAVVQMRGAGLVILTIALLYLVVLVTNGSLRRFPAASLTYAALYTLPVGFALAAAAYVQKVLGRLKIGRFVVTGLIIAAGYALMIVLVFIRRHDDIQGAIVFKQVLVGFKLGAAMGLGFELVDLIGPRRKHPPKTAGRAQESAGPGS